MRILLFCCLFGFGFAAHAQIPIEVFAGHQRTTIDLMFFRFFKNKKGENSPWLFFNRNRASVDYRMTQTAYLPQFGFTEAISYNHPKLKGFAPVVVGQVLSWGVYPKAGLQYAHVKPQLTVFSWLVCETWNQPHLDYFLLLRYTPKLSEKLHLFTQLESLNTFPTVAQQALQFTQRLRLGLKIKAFQGGAGADFTQSGRQSFVATYNIGGFVRYEF